MTTNQIARPLKIIAIVGATATGKTRMAVEVAHALGSEIISADSRQVYRGLDIGTGKDLAEYDAFGATVPYHLIDVVEVETTYTLFRYQRDCYDVMRKKHCQEPFRSGTPLVLAGGSALYIAAVLTDYRIPDVPENPTLRAELMQEDLEALRQRLKDEHPALFAETDVSTKVRVVRALEIAAFAGDGPVPYAPPLEFPLDAKVYAIRIERAELHRRIDSRLRERIEEGLVQEVRELLDRGVPAERLRRLGLEYAQVTSHLLGEKSLEQMERDLAAAIHNFAKRQETWFRGFPEKRGIPVDWIAPGDVAPIIEAAGRW
jgi:tRNA dimethylallyltransferase